MTRRSGMPVGADVRERMRAAQRAESEAITTVQKALAAEADARTRLDGIILKHQAELAKTQGAVQAAQAGLVRTSGIERAAALLELSSRALRSAVKASAQVTREKATSGNTPPSTTTPTIGHAET